MLFPRQLFRPFPFFLFSIGPTRQHLFFLRNFLVFPFFAIFSPQLLTDTTSTTFFYPKKSSFPIPQFPNFLLPKEPWPPKILSALSPSSSMINSETFAFPRSTKFPSTKTPTSFPIPPNFSLTRPTRRKSNTPSPLRSPSLTENRPSSNKILNSSFLSILSSSSGWLPSLTAPNSVFSRKSTLPIKNPSKSLLLPAPQKPLLLPKRNCPHPLSLPLPLLATSNSPLFRGRSCNITWLWHSNTNLASCLSRCPITTGIPMHTHLKPCTNNLLSFPPALSCRIILSNLPATPWKQPSFLRNSLPLAWRAKNNVPLSSASVNLRLLRYLSPSSRKRSLHLLPLRTKSLLLGIRLLPRTLLSPHSLFLSVKSQLPTLLFGKLLQKMLPLKRQLLHKRHLPSLSRKKSIDLRRALLPTICRMITTPGMRITPISHT